MVQTESVNTTNNSGNSNSSTNSIIHNLNPGEKKWKVYAHNIIARENDDLVFEVSANKEIIFKEGDTSYNLSQLISNDNNVILGEDASFVFV